MFKHFLLNVVLAAVACTFTASVIAQDKGNNAPQSAPANGPEHGRGYGHFDPAKRADMLAKQLSLTDDQKAKVLDIYKAEQSKMEDARSDSSASPEDRRAKMMEIHKGTDDQIRALLNSDQQKKWDEMQSKREQWQGHRHDGQGAPVSNQQN